MYMTPVYEYRNVAQEIPYFESLSYEQEISRYRIDNGIPNAFSITLEDDDIKEIDDIEHLPCNDGKYFNMRHPWEQDEDEEDDWYCI